MVEAKIFILYGAANKGKSTTLNTLFNQICWKFSKFLVFFERHGNGLDFVAVFDHEGQRIGFIHLVIMNTRLGEIYTNFIRIIVILFLARQGHGVVVAMQ